MEVVNLLAADTPLPSRNGDHPLSGEWNDHRDCHIWPDLILGARAADFTPSRRFLHPNQEPAAENGKRSLQKFQPGVVMQIEKPVDVPP